MRVYCEIFTLHKLVPSNVMNTALAASRKVYLSGDSFNPFWLMIISGIYFSVGYVVSLVIELTC